MDNQKINTVLEVLEKFTKDDTLPVEKYCKQCGHDPFKTLITIMLSSRTKDEVTANSARRLFATAKAPADIEKMSVSEIEKLIFPVGFYKTKAKNIKKIAHIVRHKHNGIVPNSIEALTELPGVGRKTANLVVSVAFQKPGICVDTHVHRISNRLGYVATKTPHETEIELRQKLPKRWWRKINRILVIFGQKTCTPVSPFCSKCPIAKFCEKNGVTKER